MLIPMLIPIRVLSSFHLFFKNNIDTTTSIQHMVNLSYLGYIFCPHFKVGFSQFLGLQFLLLSLNEGHGKLFLEQIASVVAVRGMQWRCNELDMKNMRLRYKLIYLRITNTQMGKDIKLSAKIMEFEFASPSRFVET